jgi:hypothetical protein
MFLVELQGFAGSRGPQGLRILDWLGVGGNKALLAIISNCLCWSVTKLGGGGSDWSRVVTWLGGNTIAVWGGGPITGGGTSGHGIGTCKGIWGTTRGRGLGTWEGGGMRLGVLVRGVDIFLRLMHRYAMLAVMMTVRRVPLTISIWA